MANESIKHPDALADVLAASVNCQGTCTYKIVGSTTTVSGQCTGGASCPPCPPIYSPSTIGLIKKLTSLIKNPEVSFPVPCGLVTADAQVLKLFDEYALLYDEAIAFKRKSNLYRGLSLLLTVVSLLLILALFYTLVIR